MNEGVGLTARPFIFTNNQRLKNMACTQTLGGLTRDCSNNMGGIKEVYIANYDDVSAVTFSNDIITAFTMVGSAKFKKYAFRPQTAELVSTPQVSSENGVAYIQSVLTLQFAKMDTTKRLEINALSLGDLVIVVVDNNGKMWYLGKDAPVVASGGDSGTGKAFGDANRYGIQLTDNSREYPFEVTATIPV